MDISRTIWHALTTIGIPTIKVVVTTAKFQYSILYKLNDQASNKVSSLY